MSAIGAPAPLPAQDRGTSNLPAPRRPREGRHLGVLLLRSCSFGCFSPGISKADSQALLQLQLTENNWSKNKTKQNMNSCFRSSLRTASISVFHEAEGQAGAGGHGGTGNVCRYRRWHYIEWARFCWQTTQATVEAFFFHVLKCPSMALERLTNRNYYSLENLHKLIILLTFWTAMLLSF